MRDEHGNVGGGADAERAFGQSQQAGRADGKPGDQVRQRHPPGMNKLHESQRQLGFQPGDSKRGVIKLDFLFVTAMGRVVAADDLQRSIRNGSKMASRSRADARAGSS